MQRAKVFRNGRSQAVRLPKDYQVSGEEVYVTKLGEAVVLTPLGTRWETFLGALDLFTDDFMADGRPAEVTSQRDSL